VTQEIDNAQPEITKVIAGQVVIIARLLRLRDAPAYLGMDRHCFNKTVRPTVKLVRIGKQGIAFDRLDLDAWVEHTKACSARPAASNLRRMQTWDKKERQDSTNAESVGTSTKRSLDVEFAKALGQASLKKPKKF